MLPRSPPQPVCIVLHIWTLRHENLSPSPQTEIHHPNCGAPAARVWDFIEKGLLPVAQVKFFVLDEADRLLDTGNQARHRKSQVQTIGGRLRGVWSCHKLVCIRHLVAGWTGGVLLDHYVMCVGRHAWLGRV